MKYYKGQKLIVISEAGGNISKENSYHIKDVIETENDNLIYIIDLDTLKGYRFEESSIGWYFKGVPRNINKKIFIL
jgi:hypothetical protein